MRGWTLLAIVLCGLATQAVLGEEIMDLSGTGGGGRKILQSSFPVQVSATFDINKYQEDLVNLAKDLLKGQPDRGAFVKDLCNKAIAAYPDYNVLICNINQDCSPSVSGGPNRGSPAYSSLDFTATNTDVKFGTWIFKSGSLDHCKSDGGFINWCFSGGSRSGDGGCKVNW